MAPRDTLDRYLQALPAGYDSYRDVTAKGSLLRHFIRLSELRADETPPELRSYVLDPPTLGGWVPEVHLNAFLALAYDARFADAGAMPAYEAWTFAGNRQVLGSVLYRILFAVVSPERLFLGTGKRWSAFHRGTTLAIEASTGTSARVRLQYPKNLHTELSVRGLGTAFRAAVELAGARNVQVRVGEVGGESTAFEVEWMTGSRES
jgi:uncharacterized protein (TIGR02265 family)